VDETASSRAPCARCRSRRGPRRRSTRSRPGWTRDCCSPALAAGHLNLHNWRADEWTPAVKAAGLEHRSPYALRHTFATFAIAAGVSLFELARFMGTSVEQIDRT
jgi:integrase